MKKYDILETSKMSAEYDGNLIEVTYATSEATLENGRLVTIENGKVRYAKATDTGRLYLHASVEKMFDESLGLTEFCKVQNDLVRIFGMRTGDEFKTTAFAGTLAVGDKVVLASTGGTYVKAGTLTGSENFVAEVMEVGKLGFSAKSFGFDGIPAIRIKVEKGIL